MSLVVWRSSSPPSLHLRLQSSLEQQQNLRREMAGSSSSLTSLLRRQSGLQPSPGVQQPCKKGHHGNVGDDGDGGRESKAGWPGVLAGHCPGEWSSGGSQTPPRPALSWAHWGRWPPGWSSSLSGHSRTSGGQPGGPRTPGIQAATPTPSLTAERKTSSLSPHPAGQWSTLPPPLSW